jgi:two-component system cell cycle sensor histidine kinase/response regulator CckA
MAYTPPNLAAEVEALRARIAELEAEASGRRNIESKLRSILDQMPLIVWTTDRDLRFTSSGGPAFSGLSYQEYFQTQDETFLPIASALRALKGESVQYELVWQGRSLIVFLEPCRDQEGVIEGVIGVALDITAQRQSESARDNAEKKYQDLIESANDIIYTHDLNGRILTINRAGEQLSGYSRPEVAGMAIHDILTSGDPALFGVAQIHDDVGIPVRYETTLCTRTGATVFLEVSTHVLFQDGEPVAIQGIARDITERKRLEEQIRQSQKMEAIGVLAGGIAHDFNNLLTGILGYAYLLQEENEQQRINSEGLDVIVKSSERAAQLTSQLLGFARRGKNQNAPNDIHALIKEVTNLLQRTIDKRIRIGCDLHASRSYVLGDPNQMYQTLLNLCVNARDAMPEGGDLRISTRVNGSSLIVSVSDSGVGIPDSIRDRIFEPFFTTKDSNRGSGMGLAMVYGIVKNHGGSIHVETSVGVGTTFHITLPLSGDQLAERPVQYIHPVLMGKGRILVIDDEDVVRQVLSRMLQELGYEVVGLNDSRQAIDYYREHQHEIDAVILDLIMPRLGGKECLIALREINPSLPAVLSTGYGFNGEVQDIMDLGSVGFLKKPYQLAQLSHVLQYVVSKKAAKSA